MSSEVIGFPFLSIAPSATMMMLRREPRVLVWLGAREKVVSGIKQRWWKTDSPVERGEGFCRDAGTSLSRRQRCSSQSSSGGHSGMKTQSAPQDRDVTRARYLGREPEGQTRNPYIPPTAYHAQQDLLVPMVEERDGEEPGVSFLRQVSTGPGDQTFSLEITTTGFPAQRLSIVSCGPEHVRICAHE